MRVTAIFALLLLMGTYCTAAERAVSVAGLLSRERLDRGVVDLTPRAR